ncbi:MAG: DNA polymerase III subunit gamma/tau [Chloroflexota bacterium]
MSSQTLYRKWRSQTFSDVAGQGHVTRTLLNALASGRLSHAYLFCGPRGVGKTTVARVLAKAVNCQAGGQGEPCNTCDVCQSISEGRALDVIEVDAASNRGIDEIRDLREKVNFAPNEARYKFYILDEAHMLTSEAANALLKTLEEPPPHIIFVLVTTEPHKLPATILSRCQRFDFRRIPLKESVARLAHICHQEGIDIDTGALELVARMATGSLRDAISLLDQLVAFCGRVVRLEDAQTVLGVVGSTTARDLVDLVLRGDLPAAIRLTNDVMAEGADLRQFNREVIEHLRGVMLMKVSGDPSGILDVTTEIADQMRAQAGQLSSEQIVRLVRIFGQADLGLRSPVPMQLPFELAVVEAVLSLQDGSTRVEAPPQLRMPRAEAISEQSAGWRPRVGPTPGPMERRRRALSADDSSVSPVGRGASAYPAAASGDQAAIAEDVVKEEKAAASPVPKSAPADPRSASEGTQAPTPTADEAQPLTLERVVQQWPRFIASLGTQDKKIQAILRDAEPGEVRGDCIVLHFAHAFHKQTIEKDTNLALVEKTLNSLLGGRWRVQCIVHELKREKRKLPVDDLLVREAVARGARIVAVHTSEGSEAPDEAFQTKDE